MDNDTLEIVVLYVTMSLSSFVSEMSIDNRKFRCHLTVYALQLVTVLMMRKLEWWVSSGGWYVQPFWRSFTAALVDGLMENTAYTIN